MGHSAREMLMSVTPALLGIAGVCAAIAIVMALMRHLLYEHGNDDLQPASKRVTHVFGFLAVIGCVAGAGTTAATKWALSPTLNPATSGGTSLLPSSIRDAGSYSNMGDLIMSHTNPNKTDFIQQLGDAIYNGIIGVAGAVAEADPSYEYKTDTLAELQEKIKSGKATADDYHNASMVTGSYGSW